MWEWLISSIDPSRDHHVDLMLSWHARLMTLAWGVIVPAAIFAARYMKIMPWQKWPKELDNKTWWFVHLFGLIIAYGLTLVGMALILLSSQAPSAVLHKALGYTVVSLASLQIALGFARGSKGGPSDPASDGSFRGDHFDMTRRRIVFEHLHRSLGYIVLALAAATILLGMWSANAPRWMWFLILGYWFAIAIASLVMQIRGRAYDTYQAIWGAGPDLPGNRMRKMGWGTVRPGDGPKGSDNGEK